jgi:hypothetical protein
MAGPNPLVHNEESISQSPSGSGLPLQSTVVVVVVVVLVAVAVMVVVDLVAVVEELVQLSHVTGQTELNSATDVQSALFPVHADGSAAPLHVSVVVVVVDVVPIVEL